MLYKNKNSPVDIKKKDRRVGQTLRSLPNIVEKRLVLYAERIVLDFIRRDIDGHILPAEGNVGSHVGG